MKKKILFIIIPVCVLGTILVFDSNSFSQTPKEISMIDVWQSQQPTEGEIIKTVKNKISDFENTDKKIRQIEKETGWDLTEWRTAIHGESQFYEELIHTHEDSKKNPEKYYTQQDLVKKALDFYKKRPDGTFCDDDRRWVEERQNCIPLQRATKIYYNYDLEWLRYYKIN